MVQDANRRFVTEASVGPATAAVLENSASPARQAIQALYPQRNEVTQPALGKFFAGLNQSKTQASYLAFFGSSSVAGNNATAVANRFVDRLMVDLQRAYPSGTGTEKATVTPGFGITGGPGLQAKNFGVGGTTAANYYTINTGAAAQLAEMNPFAIFHQVGSNDWANNVPPATYKANLITAIESMDTQVTRPHVHILTHALRRSDSPAVNSVYDWEDYRDAMRSIALERPNDVAFIDVSYFGDVNQASTSDPLNIMDTDLIHPTDYGHLVTKEAILRALDISVTPPPPAAAIPSAPPGHPIVLDYFARANGPAGTALSGQTWVDSAGVWVVENGKMHPSTAGTVTLDAGHSDEIFISAAVILSLPDPAPCGVIGRVVGDTSRIGVYIDTSGWQCNIWVKYGSISVAVTTATPTNFKKTAGAINVIGMHLEGNVVTSYLNGVKVSTYTLSAAEQAGINVAGNTFVGFRAGGSLGHLVDSFSTHVV